MASCDTECTVPYSDPDWHPTCDSAGYPCECRGIAEITPGETIGVIKDCSWGWCDIYLLDAYAVIDVCGNAQYQCSQYKVGSCPWFKCPDEFGAQSCPF